MKLHADTTPGAYVANNEVSSLRLTTAPAKDDGTFIEIQVAELGDGSLNVIIAGEFAVLNSRHAPYIMRVYPTPKVTGEEYRPPKPKKRDR